MVSMTEIKKNLIVTLKRTVVSVVSMTEIKKTLMSEITMVSMTEIKKNWCQKYPRCQ